MPPLVLAKAMIFRRYDLLALFVVYGLGCWVFFQPMLIELHGHWVRPNDLDAGYLLLAVTFYLYWHFGRSKDTRSTNRVGEYQNGADAPLGFIACFLFVTFLLIAALAALTATKSIALGLLVVAFVPLAVSVLGTSVFGRAMHGSAILSMVTPIWFVIVPMLQALTASAVNWLLQRGRWPVYVEDNLIFLPLGALEIAAGCAGLKFVQTALALCLIEGFLARRSFRAIAVIGLVALALALLCNWLRVAAVTLLALYLDLSHPWVIDHNWVGWVLFVLLFAPFYYWIGRFDLSNDQHFPSRRTERLPNQTPTTSGTLALQRTLVAASACLGLGFSTVWLVDTALIGDANAIVGQAQLDAARTYCQPLEKSSDHPAPAEFAGAALGLDCALEGQQYLSLRGYLLEHQNSEVISPTNRLVPGLGQLDFALANNWSESKNRLLENSAESNTSHSLFSHSQLSIAYGYSAARRWTPEPTTFKFWSLLRPLYPGPVWAMVIIGPTGEAQLNKAALTFDEIADSMLRAAN